MKRVALVMLLGMGVVALVAGQVAAQEDAVKPLDPMLTNYQYPHEVAFLELDIQNQKLKMAYMDVKPDEPNGQSVVLLHGKNFNGAYWETTIEALTGEGYRVIVPDQIGFGKSSKPEHLQYSFHLLAHNTKKLLDELKVEKAAVLGHSMGGMLATRFALMFPETTEKLVLLNPIGLEDYAQFAPYQPVEKWYEGELNKDYVGIRKYQESNYYDGKWKDEYDPWVNVLAGWAKHEDYEVVAWNAALTYDMIYTQPVVHEFPLVEVPTLLVIGTRDRTALGKPLVSEEVRKTMGRYDQLGVATAAKIPDAQLVEIPEIGHLPHIEAFERFALPLVNFLE